MKEGTTVRHPMYKNHGYIKAISGPMALVDFQGMVKKCYLNELVEVVETSESTCDKYDFMIAVQDTLSPEAINKLLHTELNQEDYEYYRLLLGSFANQLKVALFNDES